MRHGGDDREPRLRLRRLRLEPGRIEVPAAGRWRRALCFHDLCQKPLGAFGLLLLAREFLYDHPRRRAVMDFATRNEAKRFITLIDVLYGIT